MANESLLTGLPDGNTTQNGRPGIDHDIILDYRMTGVALNEHAILIGWEPLGPQGHRLIEANPLTNDGGLANDDPGTVINEKAGTDLGTGVNIDAGQGMRDFSNHAGNQRQPKQVQFMRQPMIDHRSNARIANQNLIDTAASAVVAATAAPRARRQPDPIASA